MTILQCISPVDGRVYVERSAATAAEIERTLSRSAAAQKHWRGVPLSVRKSLCSRAIDAFIANKQEIACELSWQMGRPISQTPGEVDGFAERARHMISIAEVALQTITPAAKQGFTRHIKREPLGIVFVVAPWNYPYLTAVNAILPALLAGNSVILKHSAQTPLCAERLHQAFTEAGLPEDVFQYLHLSHEDTTKIIQSNEIDFLAFTGSVAGGRAVQTAAANSFIGVGLELGGKDPAYVRHDANLPNAIETLTDGAFFNSGQSCCGIERIYVAQSLFADFVEGVVALAKDYKLGRPDDANSNLGPLVKTSAAEFVRGQIDDAISAGAQALIDPAGFAMNQTGSPYLAPQVLINVDHRMRIMTQESFGPVVGIMPVSGDEQALQLMNDSSFGLSASVFTQDEAAALALGEQVDTGTWFMNRCDYLDPALAWTGVKNSGRGCTLSALGFEQFTRPKSYHLKKI